MANLTDTYYAAEAIHGYGVQWEIGDGTSPEVFEAVPYVRKITPGAMTTAVIDKTHLRSPSAHREKKAGLRDSGPFAMELIYYPKHESQSNAGGGTGSFAAGGLCYMWINRLEKNMKFVLPDGSPETEIPFTGVITKYQPGEMGADGIIPLMIEVTPVADFSASLP
ncbi:MAG: hypothetical protein OEW98_00020 [Betaproteobacteria bacterium]|nr:hypothetical protein [Betaproteobacteria bacterium]